MKITSKTTRAEMAQWIKEQASLIDALKITRDEMRKEVAGLQARGSQPFWRDLLFVALASFLAGAVTVAIIW
jgi:hypothetical protein